MTTEEKLKSNPLKTREDAKRAVRDILEPLKPHFSPKKAFLELGHTSAAYSDETAMIEAFSRPLWALAPLFTDGEDETWAEIYRSGFIAGTDPSSDEYWGPVSDYDQKLVEMAAMGFGLTLAPDKLWDPLTDTQKQNLYNWLNLVNERKAWDCNWQLFAVMVNLGFRRVGMPYNEKVVKSAFDRVEKYYLGDGWYADGVNAHCDYYVPYAIYFYSLVYAKVMEKEDAQFSALIKSRAKEFANDFIYFFSPDGSAVPFGRSMTYRFAQCAFWSAYAFAEVDGFSMGVVKGIILRNIRSWFQRPILSDGGLLTIGHGYPNLIMTEGYNAPGSPYWALKSFFILALPQSHPFWQCEEEPLPELRSIHPMPHAHMIAARQNNHAVLFNSGYPYTNCHTHCCAKYEKFAYSNLYGFSVPKSDMGLARGAFDSALAFSEHDGLWRTKSQCDEYEIHEDYIYTTSSPWANVHVHTWLFPALPWSVRVHVITTERDIEISDGSFAFNRSLDCEYKRDDKFAGASFPGGAVGVYCLTSNLTPDIISTESNTNLLFSRASIPSAKGELNKGTHVVAAAFYAGEAFPTDFPSITQNGSSVTVSANGKTFNFTLLF
ncbi:MAG: DUF2264 domain-containing protein [Clostridia bacterium]|nr:DUF2264 domain-containing protein [Clostridia bacterium]